jgi:hypothetical protein
MAILTPTSQKSRIGLLQKLVHIGGISNKPEETGTQHALGLERFQKIPITRILHPLLPLHQGRPSLRPCAERGNSDFETQKNGLLQHMCWDLHIR